MGFHHSRRTATAALVLSAVSWPALAIAQGAAGDVAAEAGLNNLGGEIVVTARKREENLQDTPIAISAFGAANLESRGATRIDAIATATPNLTLSNSPGFGAQSSPAVYIRGIGQKDFSPFTEPGVGLYLDGVYIARSVGGLLDLVDIERVEVLRGPQGTLFGRNTIGGAVSITSRKPDFTDFSGNLASTTGRYDRIDLKGSVNIPVSETAAISLSGASINRDGHVKRADGRDLGDENRLTGRLAVRWQPSSSFELNISADGTRIRENGPAFRLTGIDYRSRIFNPDNLPLALTGGGTPLPPGPGATTPQNGVAHVITPPDAAFPPGVVAATGGYRSTLNPAVIDTNGAAPGGQIYPSATGDAPVDNFALLHNYLATFRAGQPCLSPPNGTTAFNPGGSTTNPACYNSQYVTRTNQGTGPDYSDIDIWGVTIDGTYDLSDDIRLRSISAYRDLGSASYRDGDHSPLNIVGYGNEPMDQWQISQELQVLVQALDGRLDYIVGFYYFKEKGRNLNPVDFTPLLFEVGGDFNNDSIAGFGQFTYAITDALSLTAGLRWTRDRKRFDSEAGGATRGVINNKVLIADPLTQYGVTSPADLPQCGVLSANGTLCPLTPSAGTPYPVGHPVQAGTSSTTYKDWTPMVNLSYKWSPDVMTYVTYSEGFKGGGFTHRTLPLPVLPGAIPSFEPETVKVYEAGVKLEALDRRLRLNGAVFQTDYSDLQIQVFVGAAPQIKNVGAARVRGVELEIQAAPGAGFRIEGGLGYLDAEYRKLDDTLVNGGLTRNAVTLDSAFEQVPKWSLNASVSNLIELGGIGTIEPRVDWSYRSKVYFDSINTEAIAQRGYSLVNASLSWTNSNGNLGLTAAVTNVFDKYYFVSGVFNETFGVQENLIGRPREWSLTAKLRF